MSDRWIQTYTGKRFPLNPVDPAQVDIVDIAHALSLLCRFGGHCRQFYSVAQHSLYVSELVGTYALHGLLHDASEAYCQDLIHDVKGEVGGAYKNLEAGIMAGISTRFGLVWDNVAVEAVHSADMEMLVTEKRDLMSRCATPWDSRLPAPLDGWRLNPLDPHDAEELFLKRFKELTHA